MKIKSFEEIRIQPVSNGVQVDVRKPTDMMMNPETNAFVFNDFDDFMDWMCEQLIEPEVLLGDISAGKIILTNDIVDGTPSGEGER